MSPAKLGLEHREGGPLTNRNIQSDTLRVNCTTKMVFMPYQYDLELSYTSMTRIRWDILR